MKRTALAVAVAVGLTACAGTDTGRQEVTYRIDGATLDCLGEDPRDFRQEWTENGAPRVTCGWFCATYEGEASNEIVLVFRFDGSTWRREEIVGRQSATPGMCD